MKGLVYCQNCKKLFFDIDSSNPYCWSQCPRCCESIRLVNRHYLWYKLKLIYCHMFGHKWVSTDWGNSESGYIGVECQRCGDSHGQHLY